MRRVRWPPVAAPRGRVRQCRTAPGWVPELPGSGSPLTPATAPTGEVIQASPPRSPVAAGPPGAAGPSSFAGPPSRAAPPGRRAHGRLSRLLGPQRRAGGPLLRPLQLLRPLRGGCVAVGRVGVAQWRPRSRRRAPSAGLRSPGPRWTVPRWTVPRWRERPAAPSPFPPGVGVGRRLAWRAWCSADWGRFAPEAAGRCPQHGWTGRRRPPPHRGKPHTLGARMVVPRGFT